MVSETLAPGETKTFKSWAVTRTPLTLTVESDGPDGTALVDFSQAMGKAEDVALTDAAPLELVRVGFGALFTAKNTGTSTLRAVTTALGA